MFSIKAQEIFSKRVNNLDNEVEDRGGKEWT